MVDIDGLEVMIVQPDESKEKNYFAYSVKAGGRNDPFELEGLAHLMEHVMSNYKQVEQFTEFSLNSGMANDAETKENFTFYYYSINKKKTNFSSMIDYVSQFLSNPKINFDLLLLELENVKAEGKKKFVNNEKKHKLLLKTLVTKGNRMSLNSTTPDDYDPKKLEPMVPVA